MSATAPLTVTARPIDSRTVVVTVRGTIDLSTRTLFQDRLEAQIRRAGARLVIDLTAVDFMGAAALTVLLTVDAGVRVSGGRGMSIVANTHAVLALLAMTGLDGYFDVHADLPCACGR